MTNDDKNEFENEKKQKSNSQKKSSEDPVAKLIGEKRRYLERRLSASQRDAFLIKEAQEDQLERKELCEMLKSSTDTLKSALKNMLIMIKLMQL